MATCRLGGCRFYFLKLLAKSIDNKNIEDLPLLYSTADFSASQATSTY